MRVYLAAPFFTPEQLDLVVKLEQLVQAIPELTLYSPRADGVLTTMSQEERDKAARDIFKKNCQEIEKANLIFAVIDGRDTGVIFEMGYAFGKGIPVVTYTDQDFGLNVMLKGCANAHVKGVGEAFKLLKLMAAHLDYRDRGRDLHKVVT